MSSKRGRDQYESGNQRNSNKRFGAGGGNAERNRTTNFPDAREGSVVLAELITTLFGIANFLTVDQTKLAILVNFTTKFLCYRLPGQAARSHQNLDKEKESKKQGAKRPEECEGYKITDAAWTKAGQIIPPVGERNSKKSVEKNRALRCAAKIHIWLHRRNSLDSIPNYVKNLDTAKEFPRIPGYMQLFAAHMCTGVVADRVTTEQSQNIFLSLPGHVLRGERTELGARAPSKDLFACFGWGLNDSCAWECVEGDVLSGIPIENYGTNDVVVGAWGCVDIASCENRRGLLQGNGGSHLGAMRAKTATGTKTIQQLGEPIIAKTMSMTSNSVKLSAGKAIVAAKSAASGEPSTSDLMEA